MFFPLCALILIATCEAYSTGAPEKACADMHPKHANTAPDRNEMPFTLTVGGTSQYGPRSFVQGTLAAVSGVKLKGFLLEAVDANGRMVGTFSENTLAQRVCTNALTHKSNVLKDSIDFVWQAPDSGVGDVVFRYTVVMDYNTFWEKKTGPRLTYSSSGVIG